MQCCAVHIHNDSAAEPEAFGLCRKIVAASFRHALHVTQDCPAEWMMSKS